jgi:hypothetical protein
MADRNQRGRYVEMVWDRDRKGLRIDDPQRCVSEFHPMSAEHESIKTKRTRKG